ncbi:hypothetical protein [Streptomyces kronopolitis]|uniref:hypothetical protein n=1 Tax=Streptomyces kronopolitis TaxID=1612435 RepID=UPI003D96B28C
MAGLVAIMAIIRVQPLLLILVAAMAVIGVATYQLVHKRSVVAAAREEAEAEMAGKPLEVQVRSGWATVAIMLDGLFMAVSLLMVAAVFTDRSDGSAFVPTADVGGYLAIGIGVAFMAANEIAHRQAAHTPTA